MAGSDALIGTTGLVIIGLYLASLLGLGWLGRRARRERTLDDHYLAGRSLGLLVLFFTLYATQYSGNTLVGFAGKAYRSGFLMLMGVTAMMAVVAVMMLYAPRLQRLSRARRYITPADYVRDRFGSPALALAVSLLCLWAMANYILSNLIAVGTILEATSGGRIPFAAAVFGLSLVMVIYESLGGMRSVAWTDLIQGVILMVGVFVLFGFVIAIYGGPDAVAAGLARARPGVFEPPSFGQLRTWLSTVVLLGIGIAVYPHLVQRFFAARDGRTLKRSLQLMVFMPFATTLLVVLVAVVGAWRFPELGRQQSERILMLLIGDMAARIPALEILLVLFVAASIAAIMSTVDSALLSLAAMFTGDLYRPLRRDASQAHLTAVGKGFSWVVMALMAVLAVSLPKTIWWLIELKLTYFVQAAPAILLGATSLRLSGRSLLAGLGVGLGAVVAYTGLVQAGTGLPAKPWSIHAGVWALGLNVAVVAFWGWAESRRAAQSP